MARFPVSSVLAAPLTLLLLSTACAAAERPSESVGNSTAEVTALQKERVETLSQIAKLLRLQYEKGQVDLRRLAAAEMRLLDAMVESTDTLQERIARLEDLLAVAKGALDVTETRYRGGFHVSQVDLLEAKSVYLDIKIRLARERAKLKPEAK